jgi:hypothetical protein
MRRNALSKLLDIMERDYKRGKGVSNQIPYTYSSVIDSYTKCSRVDAGERAEEILERMRDLHRNHGGDAAVTSVYNAGELPRLSVYSLVVSTCLEIP